MKDDLLVAEWIHFNYTFLDKVTHYKLNLCTFWGLMYSATKI